MIKHHPCSECVLWGFFPYSAGFSGVSGEKTARKCKIQALNLTVRRNLLTWIPLNPACSKKPSESSETHPSNLLDYFTASLKSKEVNRGDKTISFSYINENCSSEIHFY